MTERPTWIRVLVYGNPGSGKTPFAATSPNALILNADGPDGPESARVYSNFKGDVWDIRNYTDLDEAHEYLRHNPEVYEWVWLDSVTLFQELGMDHIMRDLIENKAHRNPYVPDKAQYMENQSHLGLWIRNMDRLPFNFGITAHVMRTEDQDDGTVAYMPAIQGGQGNMSAKVCGYMSIVARMYVVTRKKEDKEEVVHVLQVTEDAKWFAKNRLGGLEGKLANPTMGKVLDAINGTAAAKPRTRRRSA